MVKLMTVLSFSLLFIAGLAMADIYKCRDSQGAIIYSDDPTKMPRDCNTEQAVKLPQLNVLPAQPSPPDRQKQANTPAASTATSTQQQSAGDAYASLSGEADSLVEQYAATRKKATFSPLFKEKAAAKGELKELRQQRDRLVGEIDESPLLPAQKNQIMQKLSSMAE